MAKKVSNDDTEKLKKSVKVDKTTSKDEKVVLAPITDDKKYVAKSKQKIEEISSTDNDKTSHNQNEDNSSKNVLMNKVDENKKMSEETKKDNVVNTIPAANEVKFTVRYTDEELQMFAEVINEAKAEALDELRMLKERLEDLTSFDAGEESMIYSMHMAEQGSEAQEKEKTYAQIQRISEHIKKLDDAMDRIRNKSYGICRVCGCLIAKERLLAVPITTLSAAYKIHSKCPDDGIDKIEPVKM
jgi:RNA polymerase-binding transcription factor DksA